MTDADIQQYLDDSPAVREAQYAELFAAIDDVKDSSDEEDADRTIDESILSIERTRGFQVTISTGGPGEWLECEVDPDDGYDVLRVTFCVAWWTAPQRTAMHEDSALWRLAERMNPFQYE